jgi:hypothetical protein
MLAFLQSQPADDPRRSPRIAEAAKPKPKRRKRVRCFVCQGLYDKGTFAEHIKKRQHKRMEDAYLARGNALDLPD